MNKITLLLLLVVLTFISCLNSRNSAKEGVDIKCKEYTYNINKDSVSSFGYKYYADYDVVLPSSISITNIYAFIIDPFYNRIKRVNIETGELISSKKLPDEIGKLFDIITLNNKIAFTSTNGYIGYLNENLETIIIKKVSKGGGRILKENINNIKIYFPSDNQRVLLLNEHAELLSEIKERPNLKEQVHGKSIKINKKIETDYYTLSNDDIGYEPLQYGGINVDFTKNYFVYFTVTKNSLNLKICKLG